MVVEINISIVATNVSIVEKNSWLTERLFDNHYKNRSSLYHRKELNKLLIELLNILTLRSDCEKRRERGT